MKSILSILFVSLIFISCNSPQQNQGFDAQPDQVVIEYNNAPAEGFDSEGSHPIAVLLADQVMNSMGGRQKWDETKGIYWNFLGARTLLWDKAQNRVRIDFKKSDLSIALNMTNMTGKVWRDGIELEEDSAKQFLEKGKSIWINDSYWLVMPFKLKDSGVTLSYLREDTTMEGERADVLRLTFQGVGDTPQNAYDIWVAIEPRLVKQWAYYSDATLDTPNFVLPWTEYQSYDGLLLSGNRGERKLSEIRVLNEIPEEAFSEKEWTIFSLDQEVN